MDYRKINLSPEEQKRLLELIAEEEKRLDEQDLSDEDLAEEERLISEELGRLLSESSKKTEDISAANITHLTQVQRQQENWEKVQRKIGQSAESVDSVSSSLHRKQSLRQQIASQRKYQYGSLLAAAAVLMMVYFLLPVTQEQGGNDHFTYKGVNQEPSAARPIPDHLVCDYRVIQRSLSDSSVIRDAPVANDAASYVVEKNQPIQVAAKCLVESTFLHAAIVSGGKVYQLNLNQKIAANQWNLIPAVMDDRFSLAGASGRVVMFMTVDRIAETTTLPTEFAADLDGEPVVEFREIDLLLEQN